MADKKKKVNGSPTFKVASYPTSGGAPSYVTTRTYSEYMGGSVFRERLILFKNAIVFQVILKVYKQGQKISNSCYRELTVRLRID